MENACNLCYNTTAEGIVPVGKTGVDLKDFEKIDWDSLTFANNYIFLDFSGGDEQQKTLPVPDREGFAHTY